MHHSLAALSRGDVLACGASLFVVHQVDGTGLVLLRVESGPRTRHRADVIPDHWSDLASSGLPQQDIVIRCAAVIRRDDAFGFARLGCLAPRLRKRVEAAVARECRDRRFEESAPVRSTLDALHCSASRGRQVGRQNAT